MPHSILPRDASKINVGWLRKVDTVAGRLDKPGPLEWLLGIESNCLLSSDYAELDRGKSRRQV